jgi:DNA-binding transcriptional LysR family regulator
VVRVPIGDWLDQPEGYAQSPDGICAERIDDMNLRQIEVFRAVMTTGSVSDAARLLHVSAPAVSRTLSYTESQLGFPLFERVKGRLYPTSEARQLYHEVELVHRGVQRIDSLTHELGRRRHELVSIVCSPSIGQMLVPLAIARFRDGSPEVRVHLQCLSHELLKERLLSRQMELGVSILPVDHPSLHTAPIAKGLIFCIFPRRHPLAQHETLHLSDLRTHPLIAYPRDTPFGIRIERLFAEHDEPMQTTMEVGSPQDACALVHAGAGVALVDEFSLQAWPDAHFKATALQEAPPVIADLVYLRTEPLSPAAEAFIRALRSVLLERKLSLPSAR